MLNVSLRIGRAGQIATVRSGATFGSSTNDRPDPVLPHAIVHDATRLTFHN
jgi:hypothetical protein